MKYILKKSFKTIHVLEKCNTLKTLSTVTEHRTTRKRLVQVLREVTHGRIYVFNIDVLNQHKLRIMEIQTKEPER